MVWGRCALYFTTRLISEVSKQCNGGHSAGEYVFLASCRRSSRGCVAILPSQYRMASSATEPGSKDLPKYQNKLSSEKSPYLLQHAHNPVQWYPWGDEALEKAKTEDKLIFLSVGYSTCHWCHVMERESFEDPEIAAIMNRYYINIKVDREERPDIDRIYMTFIQSFSGHGGWPMSVFLTPDLTPVTGGTYFPPVDKYGQPGFKSLLLRIANEWDENKRDILKTSSRILEVLKQVASSEEIAEGQTVPPITCATKAISQLSTRFDSKFGGFSSAPKFPEPVNFNLLFIMYGRDRTSEIGKTCLNMSIQTLTKMANGGIHDHVGQGFARYSVDSRWHVPHFEKMLYDQGQLLRAYSEAYTATKDPFFSEIVNDIVTYVTRDLRHREGGFYSAEDADSLPSHNETHKKEGAFYVWTHEELTSLLNTPVPEKAGLSLSDLFCYHYNVKPEGNVEKSQDPHGELTRQNVLIVYGSLRETAEHFGLTEEVTKANIKKALGILFEVRNKRPRPHLDDKIVTSWNGLMISGLSYAASAVNNPKYIEYAENAAKFIEHYLFDPKERILLRSCYRGSQDEISQTAVPIKGFLTDYAFLIRGLLDLYEASLNTHWLEFAEQLQTIQDKLFWDDEIGGYFSTTKDDPSVILRLKDDHDGAEPSGNSVSCGNLQRLASYLNSSELADRAAKLLTSHHTLLTQIPSASPQLALSLVYHHDSTMQRGRLFQIYIAGKKDSEDTKKLLRVVRDRLIPGKVLLFIDESDTGNILFRKHEVMSRMKTRDGRAAAYVCRRNTCSLPVTEPEQLALQFDEVPN